jgi:hypothetical protein
MLLREIYEEWGHKTHHHTGKWLGHSGHTVMGCHHKEHAEMWQIKTDWLRQFVMDKIR